MTAIPIPVWLLLGVSVLVYVSLLIAMVCVQRYLERTK